jgi:hypothetical protein
MTEAALVWTPNSRSMRAAMRSVATAATAPRSESHLRRAQAFSSRQGTRPGMGRFQAVRALLGRVAAQRQTLARLSPSCRAISAWESRSWRNSVAPARRRSSIYSDVKCVGRHTSSSIAHLLTRIDITLC